MNEKSTAVARKNTGKLVPFGSLKSTTRCLKIFTQLYLLRIYESLFQNML